MDNEEVITYKNIVMGRSDLDILDSGRTPHCYLNDQIIGFHFSYLSSLFNSDDPSSLSFWLANCQDVESGKDFVEPLNFSGKKLVLFTVNNNNDDLDGGETGTHWSLLVFYRNTNVISMAC
ncbi:NEDD8-specific protease 1-like [Actinidia eriantha]|uniref:NEDD8-specific protease 1-like n=1 Tax=Actinidia eriantha TaxID=165200 RepID=UPI00258A2E3D|nr:NEDD8-specific protease 1-like [Actinidia eriantha]